MKKSLEQSITTTATPEDLQVIDVIISRMSLYDGYYGEFTRLHTELKYKEFSTLSGDFKIFHRQIILNSGKYSVQELASLKRSIMILQGHIIPVNDLFNIWFMNFLNDAVLTLDKWLNEILEQIKQSE